MARQKFRRDVRLRAILITAALIIAGGLLITFMPDSRHLSRVEDTPESRQAHMREKIDEEVKRKFDQGVAMLDAKNYGQAMEAFHRVLALSPEMPEAHANAGFAMIGMQRYDLARAFFEGALALRKEQVNAYFGLAEALAGLDDIPGALVAMRTYLHLAPADDPYRHKAETAIREWTSQADVKSMPGKE